MHALGAELRGEAVLVEQIVNDLVEEPELGGEAPPHRPFGLGDVAHRERAADRRFEEPPRLQRVQAREVAASSADVVVLAPDHAEGRPRELPGNGGGRIGEREVKSLSEQCVAIQDRRRLVELDVRGCAPAPDRVVVERGQIVVDHAEGVHELDGGRGRQELLRPGARGFTARQAEERPDAFAAPLEAVAHGFLQAAELGGERKCSQVLLDQLAVLVESRHLRTRLTPRSFQLGLDLPRELGKLAEDVDRRFGVFDRLEAPPGLLEPAEELLGPPEGVLGSAHAARSLAIRPRMPFTRRPASSDA